MVKSSDTYEVACTFTGAETANAVQIYDHASDEELWIPLSQVLEMHGRKEHQRTDGTIVMTAWIARQKGLL